jgi:hypothetical protein
MEPAEIDSRRAFVTCSARSVAAVGALLAEVETLLQGAGWRTRVPRRLGARDPIGAADRRRLRLESYGEIERAGILLHVPAPASLGGARLNREVAHAVRVGVPVLIITAAEDRARLGIGLPSPERLAWLQQTTGSRCVERLADLGALVASTAR